MLFEMVCGKHDSAVSLRAFHKCTCVGAYRHQLPWSSCCCFLHLQNHLLRGKCSDHDADARKGVFRARCCTSSMSIDINRHPCSCWLVTGAGRLSLVHPSKCYYHSMRRPAKATLTMRL